MSAGLVRRGVSRSMRASGKPRGCKPLSHGQSPASLTGRPPSANACSSEFLSSLDYEVYADRETAKGISADGPLPAWERRRRTTVQVG